MVNVTVTVRRDPVFDLAMSYAPAGRRAGLAALFALDAALGQVLRTTREPMVGQMRLAWWREALARLDSAAPPGEPVLQALAADALRHGVTGTALATMIDGWEPLLGSIDWTAIADHARWRGGVLFAQAAILLGGTGPVEDAGQGWALADLSTHWSDAAMAAHARSVAQPLLDAAIRHRWDRNVRALGALVHLARYQMAGTTGAGTVARLAWHRLTGR